MSDKRQPQKPGPGQESVWDYPRPPRLERVDARVTVTFAGVTVADSARAFRVLETSHPPTVYLPSEDVRVDLFRTNSQSSTCEWKGRATYADLVHDGRISAGAAWTYPDPTPEFAAIRGYWSFYPSRVDRCTLGTWVVEPQEGDFYGGWRTPNLVGPFKGGTGTWGW